MNEKIRPNYYDTSGRLVFVRFLEEFEVGFEAETNRETSVIIPLFITVLFQIKTLESIQTKKLV